MKRSSKQKIYSINTQYVGTFARKYIHKEFTVTVHQFENVEWNKLARKEVLGKDRHRIFTSNLFDTK